MGYDITAIDDDGNEIAYMRAAMGTFFLMKIQGYDWFELIGANDCDGFASGNGKSKAIPRVKLEKALSMLRSHDTEGMIVALPTEITMKMFGGANDFAGGGPINVVRKFSDVFSDHKPDLDIFMQNCINWCDVNGRDAVNVNFC
nr:hypothetical protein [Candidatus Sigynarchaeum springense]